MTYLSDSLPHGPQSRTDLPLLLCAFISGIVDSTIYNAYGTFVSMQTGNTIFVGLGASTGIAGYNASSTRSFGTAKPYGWAKSLMSIGCFVLGCMAFGRLLVHYLGPRLGTDGLKKREKRNRGLMVASFTIQMVLVLIAVAVVQSGLVGEGSLTGTPVSHGEKSVNWMELVPIGLLSFQSAGQIVASRVMDMAEVPTIVVTSMLHDLSTDPNLLAWPLSGNVKRNRRAIAFVAVILGAVLGGCVSEKMRSVAVGLWLTAALKGVVLLSWLFWSREDA